MKLAHISDIHFFHLTKNPLQIFSKRILGTFNYLLSRRRAFDPSKAYKLLPKLTEQGVTHLLISGDLTCTSSPQEFQLMQNYINTARNAGLHVFTLPGNHDAYTRRSYRNQDFFSYLGNLVPFAGSTPHNLIDHRVAAFPLHESWWLVLVDVSVPTPWIKSTGHFSEATEAALNDLLTHHIPKEAKVIVSCHFPYEPFKYPSAHLERGDQLAKILHTDPRIRLYLHGHRHKHRFEKKGTLFISDSGSISLAKESTYNLIELTKTNFSIQKHHVV